MARTRGRPVRSTVLSALFLAAALLLPLLTGQLKMTGRALLPMHIPVLLCGFVCGAPYGLAVGLTAPLLRSLIFQMPRLFPDAVAMTFELGAYGFFSGLMFSRLGGKDYGSYPSLLVAMIAGRGVWGLAMWVIMKATGASFGWEVFFAGAVMNALPGIVLQLVLIPPVVTLLRRARLI